jgi:uroporphyrin-III C-methyltransferase
MRGLPPRRDDRRAGGEAAIYAKTGLNQQVAWIAPQNLTRDLARLRLSGKNLCHRGLCGNPTVWFSSGAHEKAHSMIVEYGTALASGYGPRPGEVWLVGAGPGDPGLLTLRAADGLRHADLVLHDQLPGRAVLRLVRRGAEVVDVGKRKGVASMPQARINARLLAGARAGLRVVRLKGGDPFLFGRGGEEAAALEAAGIPWRIVPGVTAGTAAPAAAGIPLTHRGTASAVTFVTGHDEHGGLPGTFDWEALARAGGTIAAFMALSRMDEIALRLLAAGRPPATPVAVISQASLPGQAVLRTTLGACTLALRRAALPGPALVVIGAVAGLALGTPAEAPELLGRAQG